MSMNSFEGTFERHTQYAGTLDFLDTCTVEDAFRRFVVRARSESLESSRVTILALETTKIWVS